MRSGNSTMPSWGSRLCCGVLIMLSTARVCVAEYKVCPPKLETSIQDAFGASNYLQRLVWQQIPCPSFRAEEELDGVIWYKGYSINDPSKIRLISRDLRNELIKDDSISDRYSFSSNSSLVINSVEESDEGSYICQVIPQTSGNRVEKIDVQVIGDYFPAHASDGSFTTNFQGRRQALSCPCAPLSQTAVSLSVVYWSQGEGVSEDTKVIGARFTNGAILQIQDRADYTISSKASLIVYSPTKVNDKQRFWCHVFFPNNTLNNCYIDIQGPDEQKPDTALKASSSSVYLLDGKEQSIPCLNLTPGSSVCEVEWYKIDSAGQHLLASRNEVSAASNLDLADDFGLVIKSVNASHAGRYRCQADQGPSGEKSIFVRVIGDNFPLDSTKEFAGSAVDYVAGENYTLPCTGASNATRIQGGTTIIWSFGSPAEQTTTVIGRLTLPEGSKMMSDLGDKACYTITLEASLLLNNCIQYGDIRYWCHVFPEHDMLIKSYVDVISDAAATHTITVAVIVACSCVVLIVGVGLVSLRCYCKKRYRVKHTKRKLGNDFIALEEEAVGYVRSREETIKMLRGVADHLTDVYRKAQKAQAAGGAAGLLGGGLMIAGVAASLFTFGAAIGICAAGAAIGAAGGAITVGSTLVEVQISKDAEKRANKILADDCAAGKKIEDRLAKIDSTLTEMNQSGQAALRTAASVYDFVRVGTVAVKAGNVAGQTEIKAETKIGKGLAYGTVVLSVVSIAFDLQTLISSLGNLENDCIPEVAKSIYALANKLAEDSKSERDMRKNVHTLWKKFSDLNISAE